LEDWQYQSENKIGENIMKIAIFGGTGRTGQHLVQQALEKGHQVVVLARNPAKLTLKNPGLSIVQGDVKDVKAVEQTITGVDAVFSVLGPTSNEPTFEVSQGMTNILSAMKKQSVRRLVISAGAGVGDPNDAPKLFNHVMNFLLKVMAKNVLADMTKVVEMVRSSDLDWTVVRLPMLTDNPKTGSIKVGYVGKGMGSRIARGDIADFMLAQLSDKTYIRKSPAISN
jgi:putative NADH-flavin reductase